MFVAGTAKAMTKTTTKMMIATMVDQRVWTVSIVIAPAARPHPQTNPCQVHLLTFSPLTDIPFIFKEVGCIRKKLLMWVELSLWSQTLVSHLGSFE